VYSPGSGPFRAGGGDGSLQGGHCALVGWRRARRPGATLALVPGVPALVLDPELALTIAAVAVVARLLVPDMPWAAAVALGAIVAPPDAAAATTVLKQLRPPQRLLTIPEGESLFNAASALLVYRLAVGAAAAGTPSGWSVLPTLLVVTVGSVALALLLARLTLVVTARIRDVATAVVFQFCGTFGVWLLAEGLHLSGIITIPWWYSRWRLRAVRPPSCPRASASPRGRCGKSRCSC
jgi:hypothetical protein